MSQALTDRQLRERSYYEEYVRRTAPGDVDLEPVLGRQRRPWNSYWYMIELAQAHFRSHEQRLLDFGCGPGNHAILYATIGYEVHGFDISPANVAHAVRLAERCGTKARTHLSVGAAESLDYPDDFFDVIVGVDILHHVDIEKAIAECIRVLKKRGLAFFHEPLRVPFFDALRESAFGRWLVPKAVSFERHVTEDERKLTPADLHSIRRLDPNATARRFLLTSRLDRFIPHPKNKPSLLEKLDYNLMKVLPGADRLGGVIVLTLINRK